MDHSLLKTLNAKIKRTLAVGIFLGALALYLRVEVGDRLLQIPINRGNVEALTVPARSLGNGVAVFFFVAVIRYTGLQLTEWRVKGGG